MKNFVSSSFSSLRNSKLKAQSSSYYLQEAGTTQAKRAKLPVKERGTMTGVDRLILGLDLNAYSECVVMSCPCSPYIEHTVPACYHLFYDYLPAIHIHIIRAYLRVGHVKYR